MACAQLVVAQAGQPDTGWASPRLAPIWLRLVEYSRPGAAGGGRAQSPPGRHRPTHPRWSGGLGGIYSKVQITSPTDRSRVGGSAAGVLALIGVVPSPHAVGGGGVL